jgi:hypothetical protein
MRNYWLVSHRDTHHTRRVSEAHAYIAASVRSARREFANWLKFAATHQIRTDWRMTIGSFHMLNGHPLFRFWKQKLPANSHSNARRR